VKHVKQLCVLACAAAVVTVAVGVVVAQQPARGTPPPVLQPLTTSKFLSHDTVAGCSKAGTFVNTPDYIVQCSHRIEPGVVEVHTKETDVIYVIDGSATFVTGGKVLNVTAANPLQPRGTDIQGGESHQLTKGDVIVVPAGQPHWFKEVPASVSYYVVKVLTP
jgi:mannose-6-phosphate isomerase-like protein (cupin superfamily)